MTASATTNYETVIGLEVHVQLLTQSKMFCSCRADYQAAGPNTLVCPVCLGAPGTLPVINKRALELTMMTGLALNCAISPYTKFDRKNYPYPDLMKGYQISQYDLPVAVGGFLDLEADGKTVRVGITRVHLEEDVAKLVHLRDGSGEAYSLVDVNRSGVPLMEIVSEPDMRTPEEARNYLTGIHSILQYLGVTTGNMQDGNFRCDANISVRPAGETELGRKVEVKNMNSFRAVYNALKHETERQVNVLQSGDRVVQETRGWVDGRDITVSQRSKEQAHDYRYFPEPDLPPLSLDASWIKALESSLPELPVHRCSRFMDEFGLSEYDAGLLTSSKATADYFEEALDAVRLTGDGLKSRAKGLSNWILTELARLLNLEGADISESRFPPERMRELMELIDDGTLSSSLAKTVLEEAFSTGASPSAVVKNRGYVQISDASALEAAVEEALENNPQAVGDYLNGKENAAKYLVGQVMKATRGQSKPDLVASLVDAKLKAIKLERV